MISAGEASGDLHAGHMLAVLRDKLGPVETFGMGGPALADQGMELLVDCRDLAVIGIVEVLIQYRRIMRELEKLRAAMRARPPDLLVLVDYPEFNLKLAETARELGVKVLFYVSPQVWAWRAHRVKRIGSLVDMMAVLFPFEVEFYEREGIPVRFVGHPLVDEVRCELSRDQAAEQLGLDPGRQILGLMPGSRRGEIRRILPLLLASAARIHAERGDQVQFILPLANTLAPDFVQPYLDASGLAVRQVQGRTYDAVRASDAVITASGTATLEVAMLGTPMAIVYRVNPITYAIMHRLITIEHIGLANIVAGRGIVREFVQQAARPEAIAEEGLRLLNDAAYAERMREELARVREKMGQGGGIEQVASLVEEMLTA